MRAARILFVPVSSIHGGGEYQRSLILADALSGRWPSARIHFVLNRQASYIADCPFQRHLLDCSPTGDSAGVKRVIDRVQPDIVLFDCAGRADQMRHAKRCGARVVFISQHAKKRAKGLKLNRLWHIDQHWVVQPDYLMPPLGRYQQWKLRLTGQPAPVAIGPIFSAFDPQLGWRVADHLGLAGHSFVVFSAGAGGHLLQGRLVADIYFEAAERFQRATGIPAVMVFGANYPGAMPVNSAVRCLRSLPNDAFIALLCHAGGRVISAGDTLMQLIALGKVCVAAAVAKDQPPRLAACARQSLVLAARAEPGELADKARELLTARDIQGVDRRLQTAGATPGLAWALAQLTQLAARAEETAGD